MRLIAWVTIGIALAGMLVGAGPAVAQTTFVFGNQGEPVELDPAVITDGISNRITRQVSEGLVKYDGSTTNVIPSLAERWSVSADGTVWTFTLRKNVKFHDGTPFDAAAVVWNFDRWRLSTRTRSRRERRLSIMRHSSAASTTRVSSPRSRP
jgi:peptide/nickel transport system substrate-binding protein